VARRRARCPESLNAAAAAKLQVSKQAEGEGQDEEPTKALGLTIPPSLLARAYRVINDLPPSLFQRGAISPGQGGMTMSLGARFRILIVGRRR
jgi:hypothetical protein